MYMSDRKIGKIIDFLKENIQSTVEKLDGLKYLPCEYKVNNDLPLVDDSWKTAAANERFGGRDKHYWFYKKFKTPAKADNKKLYLDISTSHQQPWDALNPQCILYLNGEMVQGLDINHTQSPLLYDTEYEMYIYFYVGMLEELFTFDASIKITDVITERLYYDFLVPYQAALLFSKTDEKFIKIIKQLEIAVNLLDLLEINSENYYASAKKVIDYFQSNLYGNYSHDGDPVVNVIGHTHIDVAWLWTYAQTKEKTQRSFATVLKLMEEYPEYKFMSSQPQLYQYLKQEAPGIYEKVRDRIREGRWEADGAMWVEADCNLSGGESLIRQILFGKRFFQKEFGIDSKYLWLPDVFGYSAALPQILKKCGVNKFVTSKISWNEYNKLPYDMFLWQGIDGTEIFTSFITARDIVQPGESNDIYTTYAGEVTPGFVLGTWQRYQQKEFNNETIITFGYGDGGGGPTKDMLEQQRRLVHGLSGIPKIQISFVGDYLKRAESKFYESCKTLRRTPKWVGELYLELHRGTYTTIAKNKKYNRKSEILFQTVEALSVIDMVLQGGSYAQSRINRAWETILLNQFHDVIPGSSIYEVYEETDRMYNEILSNGQAILDAKLEALSNGVSATHGVLIYNPNSFSCDGVVEYNGKTAYTGMVPAFGWIVAEQLNTNNNIIVSKDVIENGFFRIKFDENANITSIFDKRYNREVIKEGELGNQLQIFEDMPYNWDAWDISIYHKTKMQPIDNVTDVKLLYEGAKAGLCITKQFSRSTIVQKIYLYEHIARIDFDTEVDWHEKHVLLKAAFPVNVHASKATYDIQFGNIERNSHENTSWDVAKFETCAHKWVDVSDAGYGVSLLNDCKYGHSVEGSTIKLSLLRGTSYPNDNADQGEHEFTYSLYPHKGDFRAGKTVQAAYALNNPVRVVPVSGIHGNLPNKHSMITCNQENIVIETIKKAEDSDDVVIRLYDAYNLTTQVEIRFGFDVSRAYICNMLEVNESELSVVNRSVTIQVKNYEIVTLKLQLP